MTLRRIPTIAIVGRTNVGKSSLFNALIGHRVAVVEDHPGVTRDRNYAHVTRYPFPFTLIDTGGIIGEEHGKALHQVVHAQTTLAIEESDLVIAVFDGACGVHPHDEEVVSILRRAQKPVVWAINKCESPIVRDSASDFYRLGIDDYVCVAAAHRQGLDDLIAAAGARLGIAEDSAFERSAAAGDAIRVAIIGKPNVGKSSLINKIVGHDRVVASALPGSTTDNIDVEVVRDGQRFIFVDTAGLRRQNRVEDGTVERYANLRTLRALVQCDVAVMVIDGQEGATDQDIRIAELVHERGRGLIFVVNKWDLVEKDHTTVKRYTEALYEYFRFARYAPVIFISALTGRRCPAVLERAAEIHRVSRERVPTSELNRILRQAFERRPPPVYRGEPVKLFFATQIEIAPPKILLFLNFPGRLNESYVRYLKTAIREQFPFEGIDIKVELRKRTEKEQRKRDAAAAPRAAEETAPEQLDDAIDESTDTAENM